MAAIILLLLAHAHVIVDWPHKRSLAEKKAMAIAFVEDQLQQHAVSGFALSIVYQNETVLTRGFGTKQVRSTCSNYAVWIGLSRISVVQCGNDSIVVTENTQFQIGSFTMTFIEQSVRAWRLPSSYALLDEKLVCETSCIASTM